MRKFLVYLFLLGDVGCTAAEQEDRVCIDWKVKEVVKQKCVPMYGTLICGEDTQVKNTCILYMEPVVKRESGDEG